MKNGKISFKYLIIFIAIFCISVLSSTYAYFAFSVSNSTSIGGDASMVTLNLRVKKIFPSGQDNGLIPQLSGVALESALKHGCVDTVGNTVCQVYNIYVKNGGNSNVSVDGRISFFSDLEMQNNVSSVMPNLKWMMVSSVDSVDSSNSVLGNSSINVASSNAFSFARDVNLGINSERNYYIIIWINEINNSQTDVGNNFYGKVDFISSNGNGVTATFVE